MLGRLKNDLRACSAALDNYAVSVLLVGGRCLLAGLGMGCVDGCCVLELGLIVVGAAASDLMMLLLETR